MCIIVLNNPPRLSKVIPHFVHVFSRTQFKIATALVSVKWRQAPITPFYLLDRVSGLQTFTSIFRAVKKSEKAQSLNGEWISDKLFQGNKDRLTPERFYLFLSTLLSRSYWVLILFVSKFSKFLNPKEFCSARIPLWI